MPGPDIGPATRHRHDGGTRRLFHYRIVDGDRHRRSECARVQLEKSEIAPGLDHRIDDGLHALSIDVPVFIEQNGGAKHEIAAVPEISGLDIFSGLYQVGLLDELHYRTNRSGNRLAGADVDVLGG